jgi:nucleoid DNA-binding protein
MYNSQKCRSKTNQGKESMTEKPKPMTKAQLAKMLADSSGVSASQASDILDQLSSIAIEQTNSTGSFTVPGLVKITKSVKAATPEKKMMSPLTKQEITVKAKPARNVVKVKPIKALKDSIS